MKDHESIDMSAIDENPNFSTGGHATDTPDSANEDQHPEAGPAYDEKLNPGERWTDANGRSGYTASGKTGKKAE